LNKNQKRQVTGFGPLCHILQNYFTFEVSATFRNDLSLMARLYKKRILNVMKFFMDYAIMPYLDTHILLAHAFIVVIWWLLCTNYIA